MKAVYLFSDLVRPRRLMMLRCDVGGVVHWASLEHEYSPYAEPYCSSGALLERFFRRTPETDYPTCFWCMQEVPRRRR